MCGHFLNNTLSHELAADMRNPVTLHGLRLRHLCRLAGGPLGGSFSYIKNNVEADYITRRVPALGGVHFRFAARAGLIAPTQQVLHGLRHTSHNSDDSRAGAASSATPSSFAPPSSGPTFPDASSSSSSASATAPTAVPAVDQFLLGGSTDVRGFHRHSIGPRRRGYAAGANAYWALGAHAYAPLPYGPWRERFGDVLRLHGFVTAGSAATANTLRGTGLALTHSVAASCGIGLSLEFQAASLELNYCLPLASTTGIAAPGFSVAIGADLL